ncbi:unnamed protein product [Adineta steineri]|uniref:Uncharacterized protein n=1 Tax=Adineta steineri TaxID=433720 RepID=A0A815C470_9BILA|nr:unnamed protein product [Adineta steineri]CAF1278824.1 unnamed protein product [Adineta steineri]CAF1283808.1 unnamed protein product [Adineta steineri]CAF3781396.1 unnamed protein product [Adineta steineri]CAF3819810.1 unnamed protein product [Adineta steineri]
MQEFFRYLCFTIIALFVLSSSLVQCGNVLPESVKRHKASLKNIDYINMCMFRKSRLCYFLREINNGRFDEKKEDQEIWKRGVSRFYSNW